jgi:hypothetical protein
VSDNGLVTFHDVIVEEENPDMDWHHLSNIAKPIRDDALGRLAINGGSWRTTPMHLQLGSMLVDTKRVRVDEQSYFHIKKEDNIGDMQHCEHAWKKVEFKGVCDAAYGNILAKKLKIECSQRNDDKENTNDSNKEDKGEYNDDEDTVAWDATERIDVIDNAKGWQRW